MTKSVIPQAFANILTLVAFFLGKSGNINSLYSSHGLKKMMVDLDEDVGGYQITS